MHFLYTSALPPPSSPLSTPQILCSLLQLARPYQIDGLLEATIERLHQVLDGRNAAAIFNAAAMAAGGSRGLAFVGSGFANGSISDSNRSTTTTIPNATEDPDDSDPQDMNSDPSFSSSFAHHGGSNGNGNLVAKTHGLRINTSFPATNGRTLTRDRERDEPPTSASTTTSNGTNSLAGSMLDLDSDANGNGNGTGTDDRDREADIWTGELSAVVGLQKRGLRGLMEGRRMRERGRSLGTPGGGGGGCGARIG